MRSSSEPIPRPVLPTEIWDQIIDVTAEIRRHWNFLLLQKRNRSLQACSLAARSWISRSQTQLFRYVYLYSKLRAMSLVKALSHNPTLGGYVYVFGMRPSPDDSSRKWIHQVLSILPPLLPRLRMLALKSHPSLDLTSIILTPHFRTLESLELEGSSEKSLTEIVQFINQFPQLRKLSIQDCVWKGRSQCDSSKKHNLTTLVMDSMTAECEEEVLEWVIASGSPSGLTAFRSSSTDILLAPTIHRVVQTYHSTLRELHLNIDISLEGEELSLELIMQ